MQLSCIELAIQCYQFHAGKWRFNKIQNRLEKVELFS